MNNYEKSSKKIDKLINKQQDTDNIIRTKDYELQGLHVSQLAGKITYLESDWVLCTKTKTYTSDNCFTFSFSFSVNLTISEKNLLNVEHAVLFKGDVIPYKELESETSEKDESVVYGEYNPNLTLTKLGENKYQVSISGTGVGEGTENIYAKLILSIKNYRQYNTLNKYEQPKQ